VIKIANRYYHLSKTFFTDDLESALVNKYGGAANIYYNNGTNLIFDCSAITSKIIRLVWERGEFYIGDSWTSGTTITNQVQFGVKVGAAQVTHGELVLGDNFMLLNMGFSAAGNHPTLIAKLTNGKYIVAGYGYNVSANLKQINLSDSKEITIPVYSDTMINPSGKFYKQPVIIVANDGVIEMNGNDFATIEGLYNISLSAGDSVLGGNYLITKSNVHNGSRVVFPTSLLAEF
jgi:hypothetical protein